tara:strand:- start:647 stop:1045 length:399 start_codon:yes stop_codon:yes gene_type:complete
MRFYSLICVLTLFGCSANHHYRKALKKGLEPLISSDTIRIATIDSIPVVKHDTIIYERYFSSKDTVIHYENVFVPKTRLETRIEYKIHRDTIRLETRVEVQKAKASKQPNYMLWIFLIVVGLAALQLIKKLL